MGRVSSERVDLKNFTFDASNEGRGTRIAFPYKTSVCENPRESWHLAEAHEWCDVQGWLRKGHLPVSVAW